MTTNFQQICELLPSLNRNELEQVRSRSAFLLQHKAGQRAVLEEEDWLLEGVINELTRRGIYTSRVQFKVKRPSSFGGYSTKAAIVKELLENAAPGLTPVQKKYLGEVSARELADYITRPFVDDDGDTIQPDLSLNRMLDLIHLVPTALDRAFPGYMAAEMLGVVVRFQEPVNG